VTVCNCYPLTVTDHASRFLLMCEALEPTREDLAVTAFEQLFKHLGLPLAIRSDNGVPFASPNGLFNLSKLSVRWLRSGIAIERIKPGHPQQKRPSRAHASDTQAGDDAPAGHHEALDMKRPAEVYRPSPAAATACPSSHTPCTIATSLVTACGRICMHRKRITSQPSLPANGWESKRSTKPFGSSASWATISASSIWSGKPCNPSTTRSARGCHPCLRQVLSPMCPGRTGARWRRGRPPNF
jgi:hypothetical protein